MLHKSHRNCKWGKLKGVAGKIKYWLALVAGVYVTHIPGGGCFFHLTVFWFNRYGT
jgi:hypothetical protein